jgi:hypothetical protein
MADHDIYAHSLERLHDLLDERKKVYGVIRRVSNSGMHRWIDFYTIKNDDLYFLTGLIDNVLVEYKRTTEGLKVSGTGMDMVFAVVYDLSEALYGDGYALSKETI